jgi:hypothetical protein
MEEREGKINGKGGVRIPSARHRTGFKNQNVEWSQHWGDRSSKTVI